MRPVKIKTLKVLIFLLALSFCSNGRSQAAVESVASAAPSPVKGAVAKEVTKPTAEADPIVRTAEKKKGEVVSVSSASVSVLYDADESHEYEIMIPFSKGMKLDGYKQTTDIRLGDIVELGYEKAVAHKGKSNERSTMTLKSLRLVRRAPTSALLAEEKQE